MKSVYLFLATAAAAVTSKPNTMNGNDVIWFPVDEEEGAFVSSHGHKHRSSEHAKWTQPRRARSTASEPSKNFPPFLSHPENPDVTLNDLETEKPKQFSLTGSPLFRGQSFFKYRLFDSYNSGNANLEISENLDERHLRGVIGEISDFHDDPPVPTSGIGRRTGKFLRPTASGADNSVNDLCRSNRFNRLAFREPRPSRDFPGKPRNPHSPVLFNDKWNNFSRPGDHHPLVFPNDPTDDPVPAALPEVSEEAATMSPCERTCLVTPEFNPVCGSDSSTYSNVGRLKCAQRCGKGVRLVHYGSCGRRIPAGADRPRPPANLMRSLRLFHVQ